MKFLIEKKIERSEKVSVSLKKYNEGEDSVQVYLDDGGKKKSVLLLSETNNKLYIYENTLKEFGIKIDVCKV